jgi:hypothetical protein
VLRRTEEVATMTLLTRYCTGCGEERPFEQLHAEPAGCPDVPDGDCPEFGCSVCGDALFIGLPVRQHVTSGSTSLLPESLLPESLSPNRAA